MLEIDVLSQPKDFAQLGARNTETDHQKKRKMSALTWLSMNISYRATISRTMAKYEWLGIISETCYSVLVTAVSCKFWSLKNVTPSRQTFSAMPNTTC